MPCINNPPKTENHSKPAAKQHPIFHPQAPLHKREPHKQELHQQETQPKPRPHKSEQHQGKMSDDQNNALNIHNQARNEATQSSSHPRGNLFWDDQLAANATAYAQQLASANQGLQHSSGDARPNQGENLYWSKPDGSLADASQGWVNEKGNYHGERIGEGDFGSYGHYTQVSVLLVLLL
ncbi:MAG: hypothetical protein Q9219_006727 [cf. Caloplaca sp. 3 TL-2023]